MAQTLSLLLRRAPGSEGRWRGMAGHGGGRPDVGAVATVPAALSPLCEGDEVTGTAEGAILLT